VDLIDRADWLGIPSIVVGELWLGFLLGGQLERNAAELDEFLANPAVEEVHVDGEVARIYAEIVVALRTRGAPLPTNDIWIAAVAARTGATVLTYDEHFQCIERVGALVLQQPTVSP